MVLLVDDDIDDLELVQDALQRNNFKGQILLASNGQDLMDQLYSSPVEGRPELIILDLNMPLMNGFRALEEIKRHTSLKSIPVFILTASSSKQDEMRCFELGCSMFFRKPTSLNEYNSLANLIIDFLSINTLNKKAHEN